MPQVSGCLKTLDLSQIAEEVDANSGLLNSIHLSQQNHVAAYESLTQIAWAGSYSTSGSMEYEWRAPLSVLDSRSLTYFEAV